MPKKSQQNPGGYSLQVISGGQIGVDQAALRAARACGLNTGGAMPKGYRTLLGPMAPEYVEEFGMYELNEPGYPPRTEENVRLSDGTLRLAHDFGSAGEKCTLRFIKKYRRPYQDVPIVRDGDRWEIRAWEMTRMRVVKWIEHEEIEVLNVAGNGDMTLENIAERFLVDVFKRAWKDG